MKRNLIIIIVSFLIIIALMVTSDIMTIGEKLTQLTHWQYAEYCFYGLFVFLICYFILLPIFRVHRSQVFPALSIDDELEFEELQAFANILSKNCNYIPNKREMAQHKAEFSVAVTHCAGDMDALKSVVKEELDLRFNGKAELEVAGINKRIKEWAKTVFMVSAISQNSKFDTLSVMYLNYKMIEDIILASGFRPDNKQMFKMYVSILTTSLITYCMSEALRTTGTVAPFDFGDFNENVDAHDIDHFDMDLDSADVSDTGILDIDLSEQVSESEGLSIYSVLRRIRIPGVIVASAIDGTLNALMTLRIGYVTRAYLQQGSNALSGFGNKRTVKKQAMKDAVVAVPAIIASSTGLIGKKAAKLILNIIKRGNKSDVR